MTLYQINEAILNLVDMETGEIADAEAFDALTMQKEEKLENVALWIKNLMADAAAFKAEKEIFAEREKAALKKAESLKNYLTYALDGQKFSTTKCAVSFRKSERVEITDESLIPATYFIAKHTLEPDKKFIKEVLKKGVEIEGAVLTENLNISIK